MPSQSLNSIVSLSCCDFRSAAGSSVTQTSWTTPETDKTAMINNNLVQEGQEVEGFMIEKIAPNRVIVQRDGMRAQIDINKEMK